MWYDGERRGMRRHGLLQFQAQERSLMQFVRSSRRVTSIRFKLGRCFAFAWVGTLSFKGPLSGLILFFRFFQHVPFSTVSRAEGGGGLLARAATSSRRQKPRGPSIIWGELMLTTTLRPSSDCKLCSPSSVTQSPPLSSPRGCATFVLNDVLSSTRLKPFCYRPIVFTPMDPDIAPDSPGGCTGHDPVLAPGSPAARKRKPRRLREEGAVGVAIMKSDTRGMARRHDLICGSAASRGKIRHRCPSSTDAGRNEALGLHELERRRLQAGTLSGFVATAVLLSPVHHGIMDPRALLKILEPFEVELPPVEDGASVRLSVRTLITRWRHQCEVDILPVD